MLTNPQILAVYATAEKAIRRTCAKFNVRPSEDTIADLQQGTLEKLLKSFDASRGNPDQLAWRIAANEATDYLRGRKVGAIKNDDQSLTCEDEDGTEVVSDVVDHAPNAFDLIAAHQLDSDVTRAIAGLSPGLQAGVKAALASDEVTMSNADRQAKFRAIDALAESIRSSHFARKPAKRASR